MTLNSPKKRRKGSSEENKKMSYSKRVTILILVFFYLLSLRVINWFQYPNMLITVGGGLMITSAFVVRGKENIAG
jgi:hypothetical protein